jgi:autotransporter-associated beta strand protein
MDLKIRLQIKRIAAVVTIMAGACTVEAGSATWSLNPVNNRWTKAANWTPATVPYGTNDVATFGTSNVTDVILGDTPDGYATNTVAEVAFLQDASAYTITLSPVTRTVYSTQLVFHGSGITNNSGLVQNCVATSSLTKDSGQFYFLESSSAGENVVITDEGALRSNTAGGSTRFWDNSSAGNAVIINEGSTASGAISGGFTALLDYSSGESATFINNGGTVSGAAAGYTLIQTFLPGGNLGTSTFIANPATVPGAEGGWVEMDVGTCAGTNFIANGATVAGCQAGQIYAYGAEYGTGLGVATFVGNDGNGANAQGGLIDVFNLPLSDQTVVIANAGTNGGLGGTILIEAEPVLDVPQFQVFGNGTLDLTNTTGTIAIGSLAGDGIVLLDGHDLNVGNNNLSTTFSGVIQESGGLTKAGAGTLTLTGANTYTGATTITAGVLVVSNTSGSGTGTGAVNVNAGTLGGKGIIVGAVTIGTGSGVGASLAPGAASNQGGKLTLKKTLTFKSDSTYTYKVNTSNGRADLVRAKGIRIESGAQFAFQPKGNHALTLGAVFTVLNNVSPTPISGTFVNLPDNSIFTVGRNNYHVSYEGGDGNDLTLTLVP